MNEHKEGRALVVVAVALALLAAGCGVTPTPPPPPTPTQPAASEAPVSAEEDVLGTWQVEGTAGDPLLLVFAKGQKFGAFTGSKQLDYGIFTIKEEQLNLITSLKACRLCKGSYRVYVTQQEGQPARLRFVLNGQDANATRASALDGKTATWQPGALPGEAPVGAVGDVTGAWQARETSYGTVWLTFNSDRSQHIEFSTWEGGGSGGFSVADGKLVFDPGTPDAGSYAVFARKQGDKVVQLRFVLLNDPNDVRAAVLQLSLWTPTER